MADEISEEGQRARFAQWEKLGLDQVKHNLLNGGHRVVGGPPQVRELAWQWVRKKEAEEAAASVVRQVRRKEAEDIAAAANMARQVSAFDPVDDVLRSGDPIMDYDLRPVGPSKNLASSISQSQPGDILTLKPGIWGMSIDLKELWRWGRTSIQRWRSRS
jgi:hypothetical protein